MKKTPTFSSERGMKSIEMIRKETEQHSRFNCGEEEANKIQGPKSHLMTRSGWCVEYYLTAGRDMLGEYDRLVILKFICIHQQIDYRFSLHHYGTSSISVSKGEAIESAVDAIIEHTISTKGFDPRKARRTLRDLWRIYVKREVLVQ